MILQALHYASNQILATGYHDSSDKIFHMSCHGVLVYGHPQVVYATKFAAQLVFYKLGEAARRQQLAWFHSASDHTHWQVARGYWFESMAHQVLSNGGDFPFRLLGKCMGWLVCILFVLLPLTLTLLICCYVLACSVWLSTRLLRQTISMQSSVGIILSSLPLLMSSLVSMFAAPSIEVVRAEVLLQSHAGSSTCYTLRLPAASEVLVFTSLTELAHVFQVDSMASYAQPKYSNHPRFDALNCATLCFQVS